MSKNVQAAGLYLTACTFLSLSMNRHKGFLT